jgi:hypothetical protein
MDIRALIDQAANATAEDLAVLEPLPARHAACLVRSLRSRPMPFEV